MKRRSVFVLGILAIVLATSAAPAETLVGGYISTDAHWTIDGAPYIVEGNIVIDSGAVLTIDPSVEVRFEPQKFLRVDSGQLTARGTEEEPIYITTTAPDPFKEDYPWDCIWFNDGTVDANFDEMGSYTDGSIIEYALIEYAGGDKGALFLQGAAPYIAHNIIQRNSTRGIYATDATGLHLYWNSVVDNNIVGGSIGEDGGGVYIRSSSNVLVLNNTIMQNSADGLGGGLYLQDCPWAVLPDNTITGNSGYLCGGVFVKTSAYVTFSDNVITDNSGDGLYLSFSDDATLTGDHILNNTGRGIHVSQSSDGLIVSTDPNNPTWLFDNGDFQLLNNNDFGYSFLPNGPGNVDARYVWWRSSDEALVQADIYDFYDNQNLGVVFYDPWILSYLGDFELDGDVDLDDLAVLCGEWLFEELSADVAPNGGDGFVNFLDWAIFADGWQTTHDIFDLAEFADQWLKTGSNDLIADIAPTPDGDGIVNLPDFAALANNWLSGL